MVLNGLYGKFEKKDKLDRKLEGILRGENVDKLYGKNSRSITFADGSSMGINNYMNRVKAYVRVCKENDARVNYGAISDFMSSNNYYLERNKDRKDAVLEEVVYTLVNDENVSGEYEGEVLQYIVGENSDLARKRHDITYSVDEVEKKRDELLQYAVRGDSDLARGHDVVGLVNEIKEEGDHNEGGSSYSDTLREKFVGGGFIGNPSDVFGELPDSPRVSVNPLLTKHWDAQEEKIQMNIWKAPTRRGRFSSYLSTGFGKIASIATAATSAIRHAIYRPFVSKNFIGSS